MAAVLTAQPVESVDSVGEFFAATNGRFGIGVICHGVGKLWIREFFGSELVALRGIFRMVAGITPTRLIVYCKKDHQGTMNPTMQEVQRELSKEYKFEAKPKRDKDGKIWQFEFAD